MEETVTGLTANGAAVMVVLALRKWAEGSSMRINAWLEPNGDVKVTVGAHQYFVVGVKSVVDEREYRLLFEPEE